MGRFQTIFFDFDGTLGDTEPDIRQAWRNTLAKHSLDDDRFKQVFRVGPSLHETSKLLFPDATGEFRHVIEETYKSFYDDAETYDAIPYPGITDAVKRLAADGVKMFVVTNKRLKPLRKLVAKFGLNEYCTGLFTPDIFDPEHPFSKPELVKLALRVANPPCPADVLIVGDTEIDILSGKASGLSTCGVTWGYGSREVIAGSNPDFIIDNAASIPEL